MLDADRTSTGRSSLGRIGPFGTWLSSAGFPAGRDERQALAAAVEALPISAIWLGGSLGTDLSLPADLLAGSQHLVVATSITNIWRDPATAVAEAAAPLFERFPGRFVLGVGAGHASQTQWTNNNYHRPLAALAAYLDELDAAPQPVTAEHRALAALGPKALELARDRSLGALPFNTTPEHTRQAREILGAGPFLAPGQQVVLSADPVQARAIARARMTYYFELPNYVTAWRRLGFTEEDVADGGSDRLIDAVVAWGTPEQIAARLTEHLDAGADHVCIHPFVDPAIPLEDTATHQLIHLTELSAVLTASQTR